MRSAAKTPGSAPERLKAYKVWCDSDDEGRAVVVHAVTREKARAIASNTDEIGNYQYDELRAVRAPQFDGLGGEALRLAQWKAGWWWECSGPRCFARVTYDDADPNPRSLLRNGVAYCSSACCLARLRGERARGERESVARARIERRWPGARVDAIHENPRGEWVADVTEADGFRAYRGVDGMLTRVTIAGIDEEVPARELLRLGRKYPFVEWAVLWSETRRGTRRYPEWLWARDLARELPGQQLAFHLCGEAARRVLLGDSINWTGDLAPLGYRRIQLNGFQERTDGLVARIRTNSELEWVLQIRDEESYQQALAVARETPPGAVTVIWDRSGGTGKAEEYWPALSLPTSFAGGITPGNVLQVLREVPQHAPFGLDVESGVRIADSFSVARAEELLELCAPHVRRVAESPVGP